VRKYCTFHTIKYAVNPFVILKYCIFFILFYAEKIKINEKI